MAFSGSCALEALEFIAHSIDPVFVAADDAWSARQELLQDALVNARYFETFLGNALQLSSS